jgi:hypothetical protein
VVNTAGRTEAIVSFGPLSGTVGSGDVGGLTTKLLPPGWRVASINLRQERLTLQAGRGRRVSANLAWGSPEPQARLVASDPQPPSIDAMLTLNGQAGVAPGAMSTRVRR